MITESSIYWITRCDAIRSALEPVTFLAIIALVASCILYAAARTADNVTKEQKRFCSTFLAVTVVAILLILGAWIFVPTTKEMALIKVAPALANSKLVQETLPVEAKEIYDLAKSALREKLGVQKESKTK